MKCKTVSGMLLILLLFGMLPLMLYISPVKASGTIYIRADGSIDPPTANITTLDNVTYTLTGNINESIVIQRNNIVVDGTGHTLHGTGGYLSRGIYLSGRSNVTIRNMEIRTFDEGIYVSYSSNIVISGNNIKENYRGIWLGSSSNNSIYHNNFVGNSYQARVWFPDCLNVWDSGYPSGGNYWSDYTGVDVKSDPNQDLLGSDGIGDTPYAIDPNNKDNYPLMEPYPFAEPYPWASHDVTTTSFVTPYSKTVIGSGPWSSPSYIGVIVFNQGNNTETFNVTIFPNTTSETREITLSSKSGVVIPFDVAGFAYGNYTLSANITILQDETDIEDNTYTDGWVVISIAGDVDGDRDVDVGDQRKQQLAMFSKYDDPNWNPNTDIDHDGDVDVGDQRKQALNMFESW